MEPLKLTIYLGLSRPWHDPHTIWKRRYLQILLVLSEVFTWWIPLIPLGIRLYWSYYISNLKGLSKDIPYIENPSSRNYLDVYHHEAAFPRPVVVFVHGGAWGFNSKMDHHFVGKKLQEMGYVVVVPNYSRHPFGHVEHMVNDIDNVFEWTVNNIESYGGNINQIILFGHSAGAHLIATCLIEKALHSSNKTIYKEILHSHQTTWTLSSFKKILLCAGVYDITSHFSHETMRAVEDLSPMKPAMRGPENFEQYSPTSILSYLLQNSHEHDDCLLRFNEFPQTILLHAREDTTVPHSSSQLFFDNLLKIVPNRERLFSLVLLDDFNHTDFVLGLMDGPQEKRNRIAQLLKHHLTLYEEC